MSILDALTDVADDIRNGVAPDTALANAAQEYGLNPAMIRRRFEEQHSTKLENFGDKERSRASNIAANAAATVRAAIDDAHRWRAEAFRGGDTQRYVGKLFEWRGEQYAFVAFVNGKHGLKAIQVSTNQRKGITTDIRKVLAQLGETASVETAKSRRRRARLKKEPGDPCWDGYCQRGTKMKNGREVPNCVPVETAMGPISFNMAAMGLVPPHVLKLRTAEEQLTELERLANESTDPAYKQAVLRMVARLRPRVGGRETAAESYTPPPAVAKQARKGLDLRKQHGKGGTNVGAGRGSQLAGRKPVSLAIIKRMKAYFDRHQVDKQGKDWNNREKPSKGKIAWLLWGGDAGYAWAKKICKQAETAGATMSVQDLIRGHRETASDKSAQVTKMRADLRKMRVALKQAATSERKTAIRRDMIALEKRMDAVERTMGENASDNHYATIFNDIFDQNLDDKTAQAALSRAGKRFAQTSGNKAPPILATAGAVRAAGNLMVNAKSSRDRETLRIYWKTNFPSAAEVVNQLGPRDAAEVTMAVFGFGAVADLRPNLVSEVFPDGFKGFPLDKAIETVEVSSVRDLIGQHRRATETATETVEINQHYLLTTKFMHAAKRQANALGLEYSDNFQVDETVGTGLAENKITISGEQKNVDAFKKWLEGNKPKEEGGGEKASVSALIAQHAETAARKKTVKRARKPKMDANKNKQARLEAKKKKLQVELREVEGKIAQCRKGRTTTDMVIGAPGL